MAIPPAWDDVWISPIANGHILAAGIDDAGRRQYIYHPDWIRQHSAAKFERMLDLAAALPRIRARVTRDLKKNESPREQCLAAAVRLIDLGSLRVGDRRHTTMTGNRGLTTLLCRHVDCAGEVVTLDFIGKSGQPWHVQIRDELLAATLRGMSDGRSERAVLLAYRDGRRWRPLRGAEINEYIQQISDTECTSKDFRTLEGSMIAATELARIGPMSKKRDQDEAIGKAVSHVANRLGNTASVARQNYISPRIIERYRAGAVLDLARPPIRALRELLEDS